MAYSSLPLLLLLLLLAASYQSADPDDGKDPDDPGYLSRNIEMKLYTRRSPDEGQKLSVDDPSRLAASSFDPLVPTKIIVHGWLSKESGEACGLVLKDALLELAASNVILVDWSGVDSFNYVGSRLRVRAIGQLVGQLVGQLEDAGLDLADLHLVGHSLGAHIMGFAGRSANLGQRGRITALDPAGPLFWNDTRYRLAASDAGFVQVIHTCAGYLGYRDPIGHVDFYPNGGTWVQPGCGLDPGACSHCRSYSLLLESIESPGAFLGRRCDSWKSYRAGKCLQTDSAELGLGCDPRTRGTFYFRTNSVPPYSVTAGRAASARLNSTMNAINC